MSTDQASFIFGPTWGSIAVIIFFAFMISVARNLHSMRKEAKRQTGLMEEIVRGLRPKGEPAPKHSSILYEPLRSEKASPSLMIGGAVLLVIILAAISLYSRH
jgi:hypothetical protein